MHEDIELSTFTLRYKLKRHGFDHKYDEKKNTLKIGRSQPTKKFVFHWVVLPAVIILGQLIVLQLLSSDDPLRKLQLLSAMTSLWLVMGIGIVTDRRRQNKSYLEVRANYLKIKTETSEFNYSADEIEAIEIDDSKNYERAGFLFFKESHMIVTTKQGLTHKLIYVFGEKMISNWDDLRYIRKHIFHILSR